MAPLSKFTIGAECIAVGRRKRLQLEDSHLYLDHVQTLTVGGKYVVTIENEQGVRSLKANAFLWGVVYKAIEEQTGMPKEVIHEDMCVRFLKRQLFYIDRTSNTTVERWIRGGTSGLSPKAFHEFVQNVLLWAAEYLGIEIDEREQSYRDFCRERDRLRGEAA